RRDPPVAGRDPDRPRRPAAALHALGGRDGAAVRCAHGGQGHRRVLPQTRTGHDIRAMTVREKVTLEARGSGVVAPLAFDVRAQFGRARPPVRVTVNGETLRTTIAVYGGMSFVGFNAPFRAAAQIAAGDEVELVIEADDEPRIVELPEELIEALG